MREKHMARRTESDLLKGQKSCRQLDLAMEFTEPVELWFWPKTPKERLLKVSSNVFLTYYNHRYQSTICYLYYLPHHRFVQ
jgi:hypothetical protein